MREGPAMDGAEDARAIGRRLRQIRHARRKSLRVVAGLAGISASYLSRLESGQRALDRRSLIIALANALEVAPTELTETTLPASSEPGTDLARDAIRLALARGRHGTPGRTTPRHPDAHRAGVRPARRPAGMPARHGRRRTARADP
ncbi:MAG: helix-turn-helix domain-containing protein [Pseudonocardiaceae bacterium]